MTPHDPISGPQTPGRGALSGVGRSQPHQQGVHHLPPAPPPQLRWTQLQTPGCRIGSTPTPLLFILLLLLMVMVVQVLEEPCGLRAEA